MYSLPSRCIAIFKWTPAACRWAVCGHTHCSWAKSNKVHGETNWFACSRRPLWTQTISPQTRSLIRHNDSITPSINGMPWAWNAVDHHKYIIHRTCVIEIWLQDPFDSKHSWNAEASSTSNGRPCKLFSKLNKNVKNSSKLTIVAHE